MIRIPSQRVQKFPEFKFPELHWLVQDFFQDLEGKTCTQWLHYLLKGQARDEGFNKLPGNTLDQIFPSTECHTFFLPASEKKQLRHLDELNESELNWEYLKELKDYKSVLERKINKSSVRFKDGVSFLSLLKAIVYFSNAGLFPSVPSMWEGFLEVQIEHSVTEAMGRLKDTVETELDSTDLSHLVSETNTPSPFDIEAKKTFNSIKNRVTANNLLEAEKKKAKEYIRKMLFGIESIINPAESKLGLRLLSTLDQYNTKFLKRIEEAIQTASLKVNAMDQKPEKEKAVPSAVLYASQEGRLRKMKNYFFELLNFKEPLIEKGWEELNAKTLGNHAIEKLSNQESIKLLFETEVKNIHDFAEKTFSTFVLDGKEPLPSDVWEKEKKLALDKVWNFWNSHLKDFKKEDLFDLYTQKAQNLVDQRENHHHEQNHKRSKLFLEGVVSECKRLSSKNRTQIENDMPMEEDQVAERLKTIFQKTKQEFHSKSKPFLKDPLMKEAQSNFDKMLEAVSKEVNDKNVEKTKEVCSSALLRAKSKLYGEGSKYYFAWSFRRFAKGVIMDELSKPFLHSLIRVITDKFRRHFNQIS
eukprot:TRINITY_DN2599_c0_g1_i6.p1 TRINITY_DN2599_c0_g1~~TRINITY_DN2599_c0_g1_i6.p1  ORF type:complete len:585 (+),score=181.03 TRINITY_DN2599_c0_g1_i6:876-2630(+)